MPALFEQFVLTWLATVGVVSLKGSGYSEYATICRVHLIPAFGDMPVEGITTVAIQEYVAHKVAGGLTPRTVVNHLHVLKRICGYAVASGLLPSNPVATVAMPRIEHREMSYLTAEGLARLIAATPASWRLLIAMAALTGLRKGEQLALEFRDIDIASGTIRVSRSMRGGVVSSPKTVASCGTIPLPNSLVSTLRKRRERVADPDGLVFCRRDGSPLPDGLPNAILSLALREASLPPMRWHDLRHSWVVAHLQAGTDIPTLVRLGRWTSADVLMSTYAHVLPAAGGDAVRKLEASMR